jgi:hypothetical protein
MDPASLISVAKEMKLISDFVSGQSHRSDRLSFDPREAGWAVDVPCLRQSEGDGGL